MWHQGRVCERRNKRVNADKIDPGDRGRVMIHEREIDYVQKH